MKAVAKRHGGRTGPVPKNGAVNGPPSALAGRNVFSSVATTEDLSVRRLCNTFGLTQDAVTRLTGFSPRTIAHWTNGRAPGGSGQKRLTELSRLLDALSKMVDAKSIGGWLKRSNPAFEGSTPLQVVERGETDRIWRIIWEMQSGNTG